MKVFITGDYCPINRADLSLDTSKKILKDDFKVLLNEADFRLTNLECPLTSHDNAIIKSGPSLKADPINILFLKENKFDIVTLANNHIMDYGSAGLKETLIHLDDNNIEYVGAGKINTERDIIYKIKNDVKLAIINVCENEWSTKNREGFKASGFSEMDMFYLISKAKRKADKVIVIHHGGHEMYNLPSPRLKKTFRYFIDCGADAVVNHHTHCIGGEEVYKNAPIFYSLGNFIFDNPKQRNTIWNYGMAVTLSISKEKITYKKHYFEQFNRDAVIQDIDERNLPYNIENLNRIIKNDSTLNEKFDDFVNRKQALYNAYIEPVKSRYILGLINKGFLPSFWNKRKKIILSNLISCESHREILSNILNRKID
ncbi:poly-gamma-glutamate synthesis protein (capsule biosynthesis protein) [Mesonia algae]|uniref:Poly-gamma-glutamate synthesis protein (Capsule biosynthesis protein) n=1 Tax=Mesonia algae TaxID=213248 RepID=A0A2W7IAQ6_9FLAO|nr:CapA family protein [Mesonia algae]PZW43774.1 poly-gamma-glutamate synthesis protein (capsule biosynthesis protein) [Mesonia algae]